MPTPAKNVDAIDAFRLLNADTAAPAPQERHGQ